MTIESVARCCGIVLSIAFAACSHEGSTPTNEASSERWLTRAEAGADFATEDVALHDVGGIIAAPARVTFDDQHVMHVFSPVSGRVVKLAVALGDHVKVGQTLLVVQSSDIAQASADLGKADADLVAAEHDVQRKRDLFADHAVSKADLEIAEDTYRKAKAERERARLTAALFETAAVDRVGSTLTIKSLVDGEVVQRAVSPGMEVAGQYGGNAVELLTIGRVDPVWVMADVFEADLPRLSLGADVDVTVVSFPDEVFHGKVDFISGALDPGTRSVNVRCVLSNEKDLLRPGMFATAMIHAPGRPALSVRRSAIAHMGEQTMLYAVTGSAPDGRVRIEPRPIVVDEEELGEYVPILHGASPGDTIVVKSAALLGGSLPGNVMVQRLVASALRAPFVVLSIVFALAVAGFGAFSRLDVEAYPNPVPPLVEVITQPNGWSAEEVERYVTIPLEIGLAGMPGLDHIRSQSLFGLSDVKCYFRWGTEYEKARQEVINRLQFVALPSGLQGQISPWNAIGEIFRYEVRGKGYSLLDLNTQENWTLERQLKQVPGVVDVVSFGGLTKEVHVEIDPFRLRGHGVTLPQITQAIANANQNVGGQRLVMGAQSFNVRGIGLLKSTRDVEAIVVSEQKGTPVRIRDVGNVEIGHAPRLGIVGRDDDPDIVQGTVLMRYGGQALPTLAGVYAKLEEIRRNHLLPPGMEVVPYYDRGNLVKLTTHTVIENLLVGMGLVTLVLTLFLGHVRAALITALNIPISLLLAFIGMVATGTSANLISLGAVDFGIVVDSTVIMMENVFRHLGPHGRGTIVERVLAGAKEVGGPMSFSTTIIGVAFLPLFTMTGVSGVIFSPMAKTYAFAIGGAILLALTLTPVLTSKLVRADAEEEEPRVMRVLLRVYQPMFDLAIRFRKVAFGAAIACIVLCGTLFPFLGGEFMPKLEEGNFWIRVTLPMSISLEQAAAYVGRMRAILRGCPETGPCTNENRRHPEVLTVVSQLGRPDDGTDVAGFYNVELFAPLAPFDEWKNGLTKEKLTDELTRELQDEFPGAVFNFSQMISDNVEEAVSGVKGENSVRVIGPDLHVNEAKAEEIMKIMADVPGVKDLGMLRTLGQPNVRIDVDRQACARYGLNSGDVNAVVQAAIGGQAVTQMYEGEKFFDLTVRWLEPYRSTVDQIREIPVPTPDGAQIPIGQVAKITEEEGPATIFREDGHRYAPVKFSVRGRDLKSTVEDAQRRIAAAVKLPYDTHLEWAGQMNEMRDANARLAIIVPLTLVLIAILVYSAVKSGLDTLIVLASIPMASLGGVAALLLAKVNFSVSAAMGFISIFGVAVQDSILVVTYFQRLREDGLSIEQAARSAGEKRLRPVLMTTLVAMIGLFPAALSNGIGAQSQKPLAIVVIGGSLFLALLNPVLNRPLLVLAHEWRAKRSARAEASLT